VQKMKTSSVAKWGCQIPIIILLLLYPVSYVVMEIRTSEGKKALPSSATNIEEDLSHGLFGTDHSRLLKADLPEESYLEYAQSLDLTTCYDAETHSNIETTLNMGVGGAPTWWNPPIVGENTYFEHIEGDDHLRVLRYFEGSVYYLKLSW
jgi:hypothetical protein